MTDATVVSIISDTQVRVRIPIYDDPDVDPDKLPIAEIPTLPSFKLNLKPGNKVYVDFYKNQTDHPIIVGVDSGVEGTQASGMMWDLSVFDSAKLPTDIKIGEKTRNPNSWEVTGKEIQYLSGLSSNAQGQLDTLNSMCQSIVRLSVEGNSLVMIDKPWGLDSK